MCQLSPSRRRSLSQNLFITINHGHIFPLLPTFLYLSFPLFLRYIVTLLKQPHVVYDYFLFLSCMWLKNSFVENWYNSWPISILKGDYNNIDITPYSSLPSVELIFRLTVLLIAWIVCCILWYMRVIENYMGIIKTFLFIWNYCGHVNWHFSSRYSVFETTSCVTASLAYQV